MSVARAAYQELGVEGHNGGTAPNHEEHRGEDKGLLRLRRCNEGEGEKVRAPAGVV